MQRRGFLKSLAALPAFAVPVTAKVSVEPDLDKGMPPDNHGCIYLVYHHESARWLRFESPSDALLWSDEMGMPDEDYIPRAT